MSVTTPNVWELHAQHHRVSDASRAWLALAEAVGFARRTVDNEARTLTGSAWTGEASDTYHEHRGRMARSSGDLADAMTEIGTAYARIASLLETTEHALSASLHRLRQRMVGAQVRVYHVGDQMVFETVLAKQEQEVLAEVEYAKQLRSRLDEDLSTELRRIREQQAVMEKAGRRWAPVAVGSGVDWRAPRAVSGVRVIETATDVVISGDAASDRITVSDGTVVVNGVEYVVPAGKRLTVLGGGGNDTIEVAAGVTRPVTLVGGEGADAITHAGGGAATIVGGAGDDTIDATGSGSGNWISGGRGRDRIAAGDGDDWIYGGLGDDTILAGDGENRISGGDGNDRIAGGKDADYIAGDAGNDTIRGGGGQDWVSGGAGNDRIETGDGSDTIFGDGGSDTILAGGGHDSVYGGGGNDVIEGGDGYNTLHGDGGDDRIRGGAHRDVIFGGSGNDTIRTGGGTDEIFGGAGDDDISAAGDMPGTGGLGHQISGGDGRDRIVGGLGYDAISGGDGDDTIFAGAGNDQILGGGGNDYIDGGDDNDYIDGGDGHDTLLGAGGSDKIYGRAGNDWIDGGSGDDYIDGGAGNDVLAGGAGNDVVYGLDGDDRISGGAGDDYLEGGRGADVIDGGAGNDVISGGRGADTLRGGAGSDVIYAGEGADIVDGGEGWDKVFVHDEDRARNAEHTVHAEPRAFQTGVTVEGSEEFTSRVEADLDLFASSSPLGQSMLGELDGKGVVIQESYQDGTRHGWGKVHYDPSDRAGYPPTVGLFHEFAHAYDYVNGTAAEGVYTGTDVADTPTPGRSDAVVKNYERVAVGLPIDHDGDPSTPEVQDPRHPTHLTENALREEMGVSPREHYRSP